MMNDTRQFDCLVDKFIDEGIKQISRGDFNPIEFIERIYKEGKISVHDTMYLHYFVAFINESGGKATMVWRCRENMPFDNYEITIKLPYMS
jgi:hypothetical protein